MKLLAWFVAGLINSLARLLTGVQARWQGCAPEPRQRLYFANHSSHLDFVLLWASLPPNLRARTRPVAGADYWNASPLRRFLIHRVFRGVLVERSRADRTGDPLEAVLQAIDAGDSLIFFPEGTRNTGEGMLEFKSGLYHLARQRPAVELVPVRLENLNRVMPKGEFIPVPLICTLSFGVPVTLQADEDKTAFLERARQAILAMQTEPRA